MAKIPSRKFSTTKRTIPSSKFSRSQSKIPSRKFAKESAKTGRTVREIAREKKILPEDELERALDPLKMTEPGETGGE